MWKASEEQNTRNYLHSERGWHCWEPLESPSVRAKCCNVVGVIARTWMEPTRPDWRKVSDARKDLLWGELKKVFHYPHGSKEKVKSYALKQLGQAYHQWKTYLTNKYVKLNLTPFDEYEAKEHSKANTTLAKRDVHKPNLGPCGYATNVEKWNKEREGHFAEQQKAGKFVSYREKDCLSVAIGTKEHGGRCRAILSKLYWKEGFAKDRAMYKKHDLYKQETRETAEEVFIEKLRDLVESSIPFLAIRGVILVQTPPSTNREGHAVDSITSPTPCELHIPLGLHGRTKEVAMALTIPSCGLFHGTPILPSYARVQVLSVEPKHEEERIDIPTLEGIHFLSQSVNQFILAFKIGMQKFNPPVHQ
ncbi:hypothetical protein BS78_09G076900 [Paspalum vaginatum]|nr:hypothetical protein BS78_09G076900 [Paspalum vaginatum]